jgi:hypothetical protein
VGNSNFNNIGISTTSTVSAAQTVTMTYASTGNQRITGTSTVRFKLPDATYLTAGDSFKFNNNSTGIVSVYKADNTTLVSDIPGGGLMDFLCMDNSTTNGLWDYHAYMSNAATSGTTGTSLPGTLTVDQIIDSGLTANTVPYANGSKQLTSSAVTPTQLGYLSAATGTTGTTSSNLVYSADPTFTGTVTLPILVGTNTTDSSSSTTGAFKTAGGLGVAKALWVGSSIVAGTTLKSSGVATFGDVGGTTAARTNGLMRINSSSLATDANLHFRHNDSLETSYIGCNGSSSANITGAVTNALSIVGYAGLQFSADNGTTLHGKCISGAWTLGAASTTPTHQLNTANASTVGAAGGASALPATPTGYITININGTDRKIPYYAT